MKNLLHRFSKEIIQMIIRTLAVLFVIGSFATNSYAQIATTTGATICGEGSLVLHATATTGTIKWYTVPFYGTAIGAGNPAVEGTVSPNGTTFTTPSQIVTTAYYVDAVDASNCSLNPGSVRVPVLATISSNSIQAGIFYTSTLFCKSVTDSMTVTRTGSAGGRFTVSPSGLTISQKTGSFKPSTSTVETYTVTYTVTAAPGCVENPATTTVTISTAPVAPEISYSGSPWCTSPGTTVNATQKGASGGTYSATPAGLSISSSGTITPATSSTGNYTVTYFVSSAGGCATQTATTTVDILQLPTASISYSSPFTKNQGSQPVTLTGSGVYTTGTYSKTAGSGTLVLDDTSGAIDPGASDADTYIITYTLAAESPCEQVTATAQVIIFALPTAGITGTTSVCQNSTAPALTFTGANGLAPYTFTYKIGSGNEQTVTTTSGNSVTVAQPTAVNGSYVYTLISVSDANSSTQSQSGTATITVGVQPVALFTYTSSPYCKNGSNPLPSFLEDGVAGVFSSTTGLVFVSTATGEIDVSQSTAGNYTITNTITGTGGCSTATATADITITTLPIATFSYTGSPYCQSASNPTPTFSGGGAAGTFTSTAGLLFVSAETGEIDIATSTPGTYTVINTFISAGGCDLVSANSSVTITAAPVQPAISYDGTPFCSSDQSPYAVTQTGTTNGLYSYTGPGTLVLSTSTGEITPSGSASGTYTVTYTIAAAGGCAQLTATTSIVVEQAATASISYGSATYCNSASAAAPTLTGTSGGTYTAVPEGGRMVIGNGLIIAPGTGIITPEGSQPEIYIVSYQVNGCARVTATTHVTIYALPTASVSGTATICAGGTTTISIALTGEQPWNFTYTDGTTPVSITNRATSPYTFDVTPGSTKTYSVTTVSDIHCTGSNFGSSAVVTVVADPTLSQPANVSICLGGNTTLVTTASNGTGTYSYQWQYSVNGTSGWANVANATPAEITYTNSTTASLTITGSGTEAAAAKYYKCLLTTNTPTGAGCDATTTAVTVTTVADPTLSQPGNVSICKGGNTTLTTVASNGTGTYSYQWQYSADGSTGWANVANATPAEITYTNSTTASLTITGSGTEAAAAKYYKCLLTTNTPTGAGCNATTTAVTVTTVLDPSITTQPSSPATICAGGTSADMTIAAAYGTPSLTYQWQYSANGTSWANVANSTPAGATYTGATATTFSVSGISGAGAYQYKCIVSASGSGCGDATSSTVTVTVLAITATPVILTITTEATTVVTGTNTGEANGTVIEVFNGSTSLGTTPVSSGAWTITITTPAATNVITAKATAPGKCVSPASGEATIPAAPTGSNQSFCSGS